MVFDFKSMREILAKVSLVGLHLEIYKLVVCATFDHETLDLVIFNIFKFINFHINIEQKFFLV